MNEQYRSLATQVAQQYGIPVGLLLAQIQQESSWNPNAGSSAGAVGIAQFIPSTARAYGLRVDNQVDERLIPEKAIPAMARHMKDLFQKFNSWKLALAAYNAGEGAVRDFLNGTNNTGKNPNLIKTDGVPPFKETENYVKIILPSSNEPQQPITTGVSLPAPESSPIPKQYNPNDPRYLPTEPMNQKTPGRMKFEAEFKKYNETPKKKMNIMDFVNFLLSTTAPRAYAQGVTQPTNQYTVKPNDTLWGIAQNTLGSGNRWKELQGYTGRPEQLPIGTQLTIPQKTVAPKPVTFPQPITGPKPTFETNRWLTNPIFQTPNSSYTPRYTA